MAHSVDGLGVPGRDCCTTQLNALFGIVRDANGGSGTSVSTGVGVV